MSPSSIKKYLNSKDKLQSIDIELFKKVKEAQMGITLDGQIKGGKTGSTKGNSYLGKEKVLCLIDEMLDKDLTYEEAEKMLQGAFEKLHLSGRACNRILRVARTAADLAGKEQIEEEEIAEAIGYRSFDKHSWK